MEKAGCSGITSQEGEALGSRIALQKTYLGLPNLPEVFTLPSRTQRYRRG